MGACCSTEQHGEAHTLNGTYATANRSYRMTKKERKRQISEALAAEAKTNELLARIPGRMSRNGSSSFICMFSQQGRKGTNQDAMVAWEGYVAEKGTVFCGVFDGHGPYGHLVARRVRDSLPSKLASIWRAKMRGDIQVMRQEAGDLELLPNWEGSGEFNITENGSPRGKTKTNFQQMHGKGDENEARDTYEMWSESFAEAFEAMDTDLRMHPTIDCFCSGTTSVTVIKQGEDLVIGNVGDSRAVLATLSHDSTLEAIQLTVDLKPSVPSTSLPVLPPRPLNTIDNEISMSRYIQFFGAY